MRCIANIWMVSVLVAGFLGYGCAEYEEGCTTALPLEIDAGGIDITSTVSEEDDIELSCSSSRTNEIFFFTAPETSFYVFRGEAAGGVHEGPAIAVLDGRCGGEELACRQGGYNSSISWEMGHSGSTSTPVFLQENQLVTIVVEGICRSTEGDECHVDVVARDCPNYDWNTNELISSDGSPRDAVIETGCRDYRDQWIYRYTSTLTGPHRFVKTEPGGGLAFIRGDSCTGEVFYCMDSVSCERPCAPLEAVIDLEEGETILVVVGCMPHYSMDDPAPGPCSVALTVEPSS